MTPQETQQLTSTILEAFKAINIEDSNSYFIALISLGSLIPSLFILGGYIKRAFARAIKSLLAAQMAQINDIKADILEIKKDVQRHDGMIKVVTDKIKDLC